ncbi:MAG TPA: ComEC/Rec2 family competence protein [Candidatus Saccharimonadales bacterium]|nr:ComEC/Rec2 family competence protein [Candidatus Saccharimonadales bacterium]
MRTSPWFLLFQRRARRPVLVSAACAALLLGLVVGQRWNGGWLVLLLPFALLRARMQDASVLLLLVIAFFGIGTWRGHAYARQLAIYQTFWKHKITVVGVVVDDAVYGTHQQLTFPMNKAHVGRGPPLPGTITVSGFGVPAAFRGDTVQVTGELYPVRGNAQAAISFAGLRVLAHHDNWLDAARRKFVAGLQSALPEPAASFGLGLLVGQRNTLPATISQQLTMVGLTHIIAVSGYNLTIMLQVARRLVGKRSKFLATLTFVLLIGGFLLLTGTSPSIVRAAIVSLLSITAWYYGREINPFVLLLLAAAVTAWATPLYVWGNVSWYLSFLAFAGVMLLAPLFTARFYGGRSLGLVAAVFVESLCAELLTLPYVLHIFGQISFVALPANLLVVALVPLAMLLTFVAGVAGMAAPVLAGIVAWPARLLLTYMLDTAHGLSEIPHAFAQNIGFPAWQMAAAYAVIAGIGAAMWYKTCAKCAIITDKTTPNAEEGG